MLKAITRTPSPAIARCELVHLERRTIDFERLSRQHDDYEACLARLGCSVQRLPHEPELPDAVFVEDAAIVLDEVAILTHPGAASRRPEVASIAAALTPYRKLTSLVAPATLDGGDVLRLGKTIYVGRSVRTNEDGIAQLETAVASYGYDVVAVPFNHCLHLKSAATCIGEHTMLVQPQWVDPGAFGDDVQFLTVDPAEPFAANAIWFGGAAIVASAYPRTRDRLHDAGIEVVEVDVSEIAKAEGALTCCSLIFTTR